MTGVLSSGFLSVVFTTTYETLLTGPLSKPKNLRGWRLAFGTVAGHRLAALPPAGPAPAPAARPILSGRLAALDRRAGNGVA